MSHSCEQFKQLPSLVIKAASVKPRIDEYGWDELAVEWFKYVALNKSFVGLVQGKVDMRGANVHS